MHICYVVGGLPFGGIETWLLELAKGMERKGHRVTVVNISGTGDLTSQYKEEGLTVICPGKSKSVLKTFRLDTPCRLRALFKRISPDIIHTSHFSANYHARLAAIKLGVPVIMHVHNTKKHRKQSRDMADALLSYATDMYISVSKAVEVEVTQKQNRAQARMEIAYNTVNHARFDVPAVNLSAIIGEKRTGPVVVAVCRLEVQKNVELMVRAFPAVLGNIPDATLLVVGDGTQAGAVLEAIEELQLEHSVILAGFRSDIPEILRAVEESRGLFVMPSEYEGFGIAAIEAMVCGLPGVISHNVPIKEVAPDALLICDTTEESFAQQVVRVLKDASLYDKMSNAARKVAEQFNYVAYCDMLEGWYKELVRGR